MQNNIISMCPSVGENVRIQGAEGNRADSCRRGSQFMAREEPGRRQQVMLIGKLTGAGIIYKAAMHNLRELASRHGSYNGIDLFRMEQNYVMHGPSAAIEVDELAHALMKQAGIDKLRKNAVRGVEIIFSLPSDFSGDSRTFFEDAVTWAKDYYSVPLISAVVHRDQGAMHCHVILLPLLNGRMRGSDLVGNKNDLHNAQESFGAQVGQAHGLTHHSSIASDRNVTSHIDCRNILNVIRKSPSLLNDEAVFRELSKAIKATKTLLIALRLAAGLTNSSGSDSHRAALRARAIRRPNVVPSRCNTNDGLACVRQMSGSDSLPERSIEQKRRLRKRISSYHKGA